MLLFLDTEYTDPLNIDLISLALVSEDGRHEFYCERTDFEQDWCNQFVRTAVLPHIGLRPDMLADRAGLRARLSAWFATLPEGGVTIACDSYTDWELVLDALDGEIPANLAGRLDLRAPAGSPAFHKAVCRYHSLDSNPWHHALHDARAHRMGWLALITENAQGPSRAGDAV